MAFTTGQVIITTVPTLIIAANNKRKRLILTTTGKVYLGNSTVSTKTGYGLPPGMQMVIQDTTAVYGVMEKSPVNALIHFWEE